MHGSRVASQEARLHRRPRRKPNTSSRMVALTVALALTSPGCSTDGAAACVPGEPRAGIDLEYEAILDSYNGRDAERLIGLIGDGAVRDPSLVPGSEGVHATVGDWLATADAAGDQLTVEGYSFGEPFVLYVIRHNPDLESAGIDHLSVSMELWANQDCEWRVDSSPEAISSPDPCAYSGLFQADSGPEGCRGSLEPRTGHVAVWTGSEVVVYGGTPGSHQSPPLDTGFAYDPADGSFRDLTPSPLRLEWWLALHAVWADDRMIVASRVFGDTEPGIVLLSYDPTEDTWSVSPRLPSDRLAVGGMVWTGTEVILAGGDEHYPDRTAWAYNPATGQWRQLPDLLGSDISGIEGVWTGTEAVFVGGFGGTTSPALAYDPTTNDWRRLAVPDGPWFEGHQMVWTGTRIIVYSGYSGPALPTRLLIYDPAANEWSASSPLPVPPRQRLAAAWTGDRLILWGGYGSHDELDSDGDSVYGDGAAYDPNTDTWTILAEAPLSDRCDHTATWAGTGLVIVGGMPSCGDPNVLAFGDGATYDPATDSWERLVRP